MSLNVSQLNFSQYLALTWAGRLYIHFRRLLLRNGILPGAKFTLRPPSLAFSYWQRYCTAVEQWVQPNFVALSTGRHLYSAGRPSRWALAHILVLFSFAVNVNEQRIISFLTEVLLFKFTKYSTHTIKVMW